jgi:DNA-binding Lrp family transcriptional regulator
MEEQKRWTFFTNHSHVLFFLAFHPDLPLKEVAQAVGITERAVQRIVKDLEEAGMLKREKVGRRNHYEIHEEYTLRHPLESHRSIGELLSFIQNTEEDQ